MYTTRPGLVLAFHGTDKSVVQKVVSETQHLTFSSNTWDWLGHGAYFWENSPTRALEFAETSSKRKDSKIKTPAVLGAVLDLGYCLDLVDYRNLSILKTAYNVYPLGSRYLTLNHRKINLRREIKATYWFASWTAPLSKQSTTSTDIETNLHLIL